MSKLILSLDGKRYVTTKNTAIAWATAGVIGAVIGTKLAK